MLKKRVFTAGLLAPAAVAGIVFLPLPFFILFITALVLVGFWEWRKLISSNSPKRVFAIFALVTITALYWLLPLSDLGTNFHQFSNVSLLLSVGGLWWLFATVLIKIYPKGIGWWEKNTLWQYLFAALTMLPFLASVLVLRAFNYGSDSFLGAKLVMLVCVLVWAADTGAYFVGKNLGKHKLLPRVSPNKTIEGFVGGLVFAVLVMMLYTHYFELPNLSFVNTLFIAIITSLASVVGDLVESMFKRVANIKDSGRILPGHGGILDRIDSLTAAFPIFTLLYFGLA